jgi:RimJ/RimL family protein N-acetyltransferase
MGADPSEASVGETGHLESNRRRMGERERAGASLLAVEAEGRHIGDVDATVVSAARGAELTTAFLGERDAWGQGYGTEPVRLVLARIQQSGSVDTARVDVPTQNQRALHFWKKLGFLSDRADPDGTRWNRVEFARGQH